MLPHLLYEPECAIGSFLEKGSGSELMIKTSIRYAYNDVKTITKFEFDDDSHIDCIEKDMSKRPPRKAIKPLNLAYFYIAYHGKTWYEARFNAKMMDAEKYRRYRQSLAFLTDPSKKPPFLEFLQIISSIENIELLEKYYSKATTYREFFENIPKVRRCDVLYPWLNTFMKHYIGSAFDDKGWYIDATIMDSEATQVGGCISSRLKYRIFSYKKMSNF